MFKNHVLLCKIVTYLRRNNKKLMRTLVKCLNDMSEGCCSYIKIMVSKNQKSRQDIISIKTFGAFPKCRRCSEPTDLERMDLLPFGFSRLILTCIFGACSVVSTSMFQESKSLEGSFNLMWKISTSFLQDHAVEIVQEPSGMTKPTTGATNLSLHAPLMVPFWYCTNLSYLVLQPNQASRPTRNQWLTSFCSTFLAPVEGSALSKIPWLLFWGICSLEPYTSSLIWILFSMSL